MASARIVRGPHNTLFVKSVTMNGETHTFTGATYGDKRLPELDTIVDQMRLAGYEPIGDLSKLAHTLGEKGLALVFRRQPTDPNTDIMQKLAQQPEPQQPQPKPEPYMRRFGI